MRITVVICTRNPSRDRLARVFDGLLAQDLPANEWELLLIDNGSESPVIAPLWPPPFRARVEVEPLAGLFHARLAAIRSASTPLIVFIDDDTIPGVGCLRALRDSFLIDPLLVAAGPRITPLYTSPPPAWLAEFEWALALRDLGPAPLSWSLAEGNALPYFTPIGAGLALRASALPPYLEHAHRHAAQILERSWIGQGCGGNEDKDLVLTLIRAGGRVAYVPHATLEHIIPDERVRPERLASLLPSLGFLWMRTLHAHGMDAFAPIPPWTIPLRAARAWLRHRAWRRPGPRLRWLGVVGTFRGLAANHRDSFRYPPPQPTGPIP